MTGQKAQGLAIRTVPWHPSHVRVSNTAPQKLQATAEPSTFSFTSSQRPLLSIWHSS